MDEYTQQELQQFVKRLKLYKYSAIFLEEIEKVMKAFDDYEKKIANPIDLIKISDRVDNNQYENLEQFDDDVQLMISNCLKYNCVPNSWANREGSAFRDYYNNNFPKLIQKIQKHNEKKFFLGKKRGTGGMLSKQKSSSMLKGGDSKLGKDESYISPNITIVKYEDEKIAKNIRTLFTNIKQHLNTTEENIENVIHTLIEGFNKSNKSSQELYDIGDKFIRKYLNKSDERTKFMKDFQSLIRDMNNRQKEESTKLDQKTLIKIDLNENEANREERIKLEKIRKTVKKYLDEHKIPEIYLDKEEYSIEPELKKKIYNYVMNLRSKFATGNNLNYKDKSEVKNENNADVDDNDLINLS
jgi:hypothetical protein